MEGLYRGGSPEQIAGRLRKMHTEEPVRRVSHETIYAALYALPRGKDRRGGLVDMTSIQERPTEVEGRQVAGHWEGE